MTRKQPSQLFTTREAMRWFMRRLWWATLPYYGWTGYSGEEGATPPPWYAHPLSWLHRLVDLLYHGDVFGPRHNRDSLRVGAPQWKPWQ